jgi:hypothetical protein
MVVVIGKWSVFGGLQDGSTSQLMMRLVRLADVNTLSGLVYCLVLCVQIVGMSLGNVITMSCSAKISISLAAHSPFCPVK